jgi:hypothetical protein
VAWQRDFHTQQDFKNQRLHDANAMKCIYPMAAVQAKPIDDGAHKRNYEIYPSNATQHSEAQMSYDE